MVTVYPFPFIFNVFSIMVCGFLTRIARLVVPCFPHHVTQSGNRRAVFFCSDDYEIYLDLLSDCCQKRVWKYGFTV